MKKATTVLDTIMREEIRAISSAPAQVVSYAYKLILHVAGMDIPALMISSVSLLRDYYERFGDVLSVQAQFPLGEVVHHILPNHTTLEMSVIKIPLHTSSRYQEVADHPRSAIRYTAKLYDYKNLLTEGRQMLSAEHKKGNLDDMIPLDFQLITRPLEELRVKTFGAVIRNSTGIDAIRTILMTQTPEVKGVNVEDNYDSRVRDHIVIPHQTRVVDIPKRINQLVGGCYPTGFRYYMQSGIWFLYAPYNIQQYDKTFNNLTIINLPKDQLSGMEVTFRKAGGQLIILATGDTKHLDESEAKMQTQGNGFKFVDARSVMEGFGEIKDNKFVVDRTQNVTQVVSANSQKQVNLAFESPKRISSGYNLEYSEMLKREGSIIQVVWESSEVDHIYPGMPVRYLYLDGVETKQIYGRVIATETKSRQTNRVPVNRMFTNDSIITVFVSHSGVAQKQVTDNTTDFA